MLPVPPLSQGGDRTWGWIHLLGYGSRRLSEWVQCRMHFVGARLTPADESIPSRFLLARRWSLPPATIGAVLLGHFLVACANANGFVGCVYGINFPVLTRASSG
jgi:hypothetical protein